MFLFFCDLIFGLISIFLPLEIWIKKSLVTDREWQRKR